MALDFSRFNPLSEAAIGAAIKVHRALGPGLLESAYQKCLAFELQRSGMKIRSDLSLPVAYDGVHIDAGYRLDLVVDDCLILEIKSVKTFADIHTAQVLTYLKLSGYPIGLLMNFNVALLKTGLKRLINPHRAARFLTQNPGSDGGKIVRGSDEGG